MGCDSAASIQELPVVAAISQKKALQFVIGSIGTMDVLGEPLLTVAECREAASQLGKIFRGEEDRDDYPPGCYMSGSGSMYFNKHPTGKARSDCARVFKQQGSPAEMEKIDEIAAAMSPTAVMEVQPVAVAGSQEANSESMRRGIRVRVRETFRTRSKGYMRIDQGDLGVVFDIRKDGAAQLIFEEAGLITVPEDCFPNLDILAPQTQPGNDEHEIVMITLKTGAFRAMVHFADGSKIKTCKGDMDKLVRSLGFKKFSVNDGDGVVAIPPPDVVPGAYMHNGRDVVAIVVEEYEGGGAPSPSAHIYFADGTKEPENVDVARRLIQAYRFLTTTYVAGSSYCGMCKLTGVPRPVWPLGMSDDVVLE